MTRKGRGHISTSARPQRRSFLRVAPSSNDINVLAEGIARFRLDFFDSSSNPLASNGVFLAPQGQVSPATFDFASASGVGRGELVLIDSHQEVVNRIEIRIEIREVGFLTPTAVPEAASAALLGGAALMLVALRSLTRRRGPATAR